MSIPGTVVCESPSTRELISWWFPKDRGKVVTLDEYLVSLGVTAIGNSLRDSFVDLLPESEHAYCEKYWATLQCLREALVLTQQDLRFAFSCLAESPQNKLLERMAQIYLDRFADSDRTALIWKFLEGIKDGKRPKPKDAAFFVPDASSSLLAQDFAKTLGLAPLPDAFAQFDTVRIQGDRLKLIQRMSLSVKEKLEEGIPPENLGIAFGGGRALRRFLKLCLESAGIYYRDFKEIDEGNWPAPKSTEAQLTPVALFTLGHWAARQDVTLYSYWEEPLQPDPSPLIFSQSELRALDLQGFPLVGGPVRHRPLLPRQGFRQFLYSPQTEIPFCKVDIHERISHVDSKLSANPELRIPLPAKPLSATALENYSRCPTRYLTVHRMRLRPRPTFSEQWNLWLGQLVHKALEEYFRAGQMCPITDYFSLACEEIFPDWPADCFQKRFLKPLFLRLVSSLDVTEKTLTEAFGPRTLEAAEDAFAFDENNLTLRGSIDRIDRRQDGTLVIFDYKSGIVSFTPEQIARGENFQALVYLRALEQKQTSPVAGVVFYDLKKGEVRRGLLRESLLPPETKKFFTRGHVVNEEKWTRLLSEGQARLNEISEKITQGDFTPLPSSDTCPNCQYAGLCRKAFDHV